MVAKIAAMMATPEMRRGRRPSESMRNQGMKEQTKNAVKRPPARRPGWSPVKPRELEKMKIA